MPLARHFKRLLPFGDRSRRRHGGDEPTPAEAAARCRDILENRVLRFFLRAVDEDNGGYLEDERDGRFMSRGEKFVTMQARYLWFFSMLADDGIGGPEVRTAADQGFQALEERFKDPAHGGYFTGISDTGAVSDPEKHLYHQAFVLFAVARYAKATGNATALQAANDLFDILMIHASDLKQSGKGEVFTRDWQTAAVPNIDPGVRSLNTHLHLMEAISELHAVAPRDDVSRWLARLAQSIPVDFKHPRHDAMVDRWLPDGRMATDRRNRDCSYGHDLELVWLILEAMRALGQPLDDTLDWATRITRNALRHGYDPKYGGFYSTGRFGRPASDRKKIWWAQAEGLVTLLEMVRLTADDDYFHVFARTLEFFDRNFFTKDGGCWAEVSRKGRPTLRKRASQWQGPYHTGRAMVRCARMLDDLG